MKRLFQLSAAAMLSLVVNFSGKAHSQDTPAAREYRQNYQACVGKIKSGNIRTNVAATTCFNAAQHILAVSVGFAWMDLQDLYEARRLALAEKIDARKITSPADIKVEEAQIAVQMMDAINQRTATQQQQNDADVARRLAILNAINAMGPTQTTCEPGYGGSVECTTDH